MDERSVPKIRPVIIPRYQWSEVEEVVRLMRLIRPAASYWNVVEPAPSKACRSRPRRLSEADPSHTKLTAGVVSLRSAKISEYSVSTRRSSSS